MNINPNRAKVLAILLSVKDKYGKIDSDWILMKMRLNVLFWTIDKDFFCRTGKSLTGYSYYKYYVPMIKNKWFNDAIEAVYEDLYDTSIASRNFSTYSKQLVRRLKEDDANSRV